MVPVERSRERRSWIKEEGPPRSAPGEEQLPERTGFGRSTVDPLVCLARGNLHDNFVSEGETPWGKLLLNNPCSFQGFRNLARHGAGLRKGDLRYFFENA